MSSNNSIGKLITFPELITPNTIVIPKVQRDYVYGREETKVQEVLDGMLDEIFNAVINDKQTVLDFVYGGAYVRKGDNESGVIPLDGQQRLTTLFLLHFFASLLGDENGDTINDVNALLKFRYETRQSATEFCGSLVEGIRNNLIKNNYKPSNKNLKALITDDALYLGTYDNDPTIISMLNVLDKIEQKWVEHNVENLNPCLWNRLWNRKNVPFYYLSLENFGLTDDLFIKMNARGKKLTPFEIFKSDIIATIHKVDLDLKDKFSIQMDNQWIDIVWAYTNQEISDKRKALDVTNEADQKYDMLFYNILLIEKYRRNLQIFDIASILSDRDAINAVMDLFNFFYDIHKNKGGFAAYFNEYFYFADEKTGMDDKIRLFWQKKKSPVFEFAMLRELTVAEVVYLYALYLLHSKQKDSDISRRCLRVIRNLVTASTRAGDARTEKLHDFMLETECIIEHDGNVLPLTPRGNENGFAINGNFHKLAFLQHVWNEEYSKQQMSIYQDLLKYENHDILRGALSLFINFCKDQMGNIDTSRLLQLLAKFDRLFNDEYEANFQNIRLLFLEPHIDYIQYHTNSNLCYLLSSSKYLTNFFTWNNGRQQQENILQILEKLQEPFSPPSPIQFDKFSDWKYYVTKYPNESNRENTHYGMAIWDDYTNYPLDMILLNSSYHSENYLEWMMMTYLLYNKIDKDTIPCSLDPHGCHPIQIHTNSLGFKNGGWQVYSDSNLTSKLAGRKDIQITPNSLNEYSITLTQFAAPYYDYIDLGMELVDLLK